MGDMQANTLQQRGKDQIQVTAGSHPWMKSPGESCDQIVSGGLYRLAMALAAQRSVAVSCPQWQDRCKALLFSSGATLMKHQLPVNVFSMWRLMGLGVWLGRLAELSHSDLPAEIQFKPRAIDLGFSWSDPTMRSDADIWMGLERSTPALLVVAEASRVDHLTGALDFWEAVRSTMKDLPFVRRVDALNLSERLEVATAALERVVVGDPRLFSEPLRQRA